jgi:hypothetical protein
MVYTHVLRGGGRGVRSPIDVFFAVNAAKEYYAAILAAYHRTLL